MRLNRPRPSDTLIQYSVLASAITLRKNLSLGNEFIIPFSESFSASRNFKPDT